MVKAFSGFELLLEMMYNDTLSHYLYANKISLVSWIWQGHTLDIYKHA